MKILFFSEMAQNNCIAFFSALANSRLQHVTQ